MTRAIMIKRLEGLLHANGYLEPTPGVWEKWDYSAGSKETYDTISVSVQNEFINMAMTSSQNESLPALLLRQPIWKESMRDEIVIDAALKLFADLVWKTSGYRLSAFERSSDGKTGF